MLRATVYCFRCRVVWKREGGAAELQAGRANATLTRNCPAGELIGALIFRPWLNTSTEIRPVLPGSCRDCVISNALKRVGRCGLFWIGGRVFCWQRVRPRRQSELMMKNILVVCRTNSMMSPIVEALINSRSNGAWQASSAGSQPASRLNPYAFAVLKEAGISVEPHFLPKSWCSFAGAHVPRCEILLTVSEDVVWEDMLVWNGVPRLLHWVMPDPLAMRCSAAERLGLVGRMARAGAGAGRCVCGRGSSRSAARSVGQRQWW